MDAILTRRSDAKIALLIFAADAGSAIGDFKSSDAQGRGQFTGGMVLQRGRDGIRTDQCRARGKSVSRIRHPLGVNLRAFAEDLSSTLQDLMPVPSPGKCVERPMSKLTPFSNGVER